MKQLYIISLEPLESRYTHQWATHLPKIFKEKLGEEWDVIQLDGDTISGKCTDGAFLDFSATNRWKNEQINKFFILMNEGKVQDDAVILFTDFWNPCILEVKYTKDLLKKNWQIIGIAHAGSYLDQDPLGQLITDKSWSYAAERAFYEACDKVWFATEDHYKDFCKVLRPVSESKYIRSGFPMEYISEIKFPKVEKEDLIVFAARNSPEKQPEIFDKLAEMLPQYKFVNCQRENMSKEQYHETLAKAKIVMSFAKLETFGIVSLEAVYANAIPLMPNHLSYAEIYKNFYQFLYPATWIDDKENINYDKLAKLIELHMIMFPIGIDRELDKCKKHLYYNYISCDILIDYLKGNKLNEPNRPF